MRAFDSDFQTSISIRLPYRAYMPDGHDPSVARTRYPIIVFLHGAAARRGEVSSVASTGLPHKIESGASVPFIVVAPQCPPNLDWSMILPALDFFVSDVVERFHADPDRVYLTGLSMGGFGVWALATEYPDRFAAVAPICGGGRPLLDFPDRLKRIVHLPVWTFHGELDDEIPVEQSARLVEALKGYGGNVRSTVYPETGHDSWTRTYDDPELYSWFLQHVRKRRGAG